MSGRGDAVSDDSNSVHASESPKGSSRRRLWMRQLPKRKSSRRISEAYPILRRLGNVQIFDAPEFPCRPGFQGYALRLLDRDEEVWRIWWASTAGGGRLDAPVVGRFRDGLGYFEGKGVIAGREIGHRFLWTEITHTSARCEQSFSFDNGKAFVPNWIMLHERVGRGR
jgi:hypothetical protein